MCRANDKLIAFSYVFDKFVEYQRNEVTPHWSDSEIIQSFSNTRLMKLLYCLCLESIHKEKELEFNETNLFSLFGEFSAFPNGPVLLDVYQSLDIVPGFRYENGRFVGYASKRVQDIQKLNNIIEKFDETLEISFRRLTARIGKELFGQREKLVELTHKLPIWIQTYLYAPKQNMSVNSHELLEEYEAYTKCVKLLK